MSTTLPDTTAAGGLENAATTVGQQKTNLSNLRNFIADLFGTTTAALRTVWEAFRLHGADTLANASLTFSVGSSALTINLKTRAGATPSATDPVLVGQRSATASAGDHNLRAVTAAASLVVSSGSTLGLGNADSTPLYVYLLDNAGTEELAISQTWLGPSGIVSTTAEGGAGAADSATVVYSTTARTSVPFRALAKLIAPQTTAGTWAAVPTTCQLWPFDPPGSGTTLATPVTASGTSIDFTGIPSTAREVLVHFVGLSTNGTSNPIVQIGDSGGIETSGYTSGCASQQNAGTNSRVTSTAGFVLNNLSGASATLTGTMVLRLVDSTNQTWVASGAGTDNGTAADWQCGGNKNLSPGPLDRVRITTAGGTDTFDAGVVNVTWRS